MKVKNFHLRVGAFPHTITSNICIHRRPLYQGSSMLTFTALKSPSRQPIVATPLPQALRFFHPLVLFSFLLNPFSGNNFQLLYQAFASRLSLCGLLNYSSASMLGDTGPSAVQRILSHCMLPLSFCFPLLLTGYLF